MTKNAILFLCLPNLSLWQDKGSLVAPHTSVTAGIQSKSEWPKGFSCFSILFISEEINSVTNCGIYNPMREFIVRENETEKEGNRITKKLHTMGLCIISFIAIALHCKPCMFDQGMM